MQWLYYCLLCTALSTDIVLSSSAPARAPARISQIRALRQLNTAWYKKELQRYQELQETFMVQIEDLKNELESNRLKMVALNDEKIQLNDRILVLEKKCVEVQNNPEIQLSENSILTQQRDPEAFGFTYELASSRSLSHNVPITFDKKIFDTASSFAPQLGTFTCPDADYYMFYWSIHASKRRVSAKLVRQGEEVKRGPLSTDLGENYSGTSTMASIVKCEKDSMIWVSANAWPEDSECNQIEGVYSSITGFKLFSEADDSFVAMTAQLSTNTAATSVPYDDVLFSQGVDYTPETGSFVCKSDGVYVFAVSVHFVTGSHDFYLQKNGGRVRYLTIPRNVLSSTTDSGTASSTCIMSCKENDVITARGSGEHQAFMSSFTAFRLAQRENETVAFTVGLTSGTHEYRNGLTIVFDHVTTNIGGYYFPNVGIFVCPDNELYVFSWQVSTLSENGNRPAEVRLMMDGEIVKTGPRTGEVLTGTTGSTSSTQVILKCQEQKAVYVHMVVPDSQLQRLYRAYTSFSGFRLPKV